MARDTGWYKDSEGVWVKDHLLRCPKCNVRATKGDLSGEPVIWESTKQLHALIDISTKEIAEVVSSSVGDKYAEGKLPLPDGLKYELLYSRNDVRARVCRACRNEMNGRPETYIKGKWGHRTYEF